MVPRLVNVFMDFLPLFFDIKQKPVLLVGAGKVALRKAKALVKAQAQLRVLAPEIDPAFFEDLAEAINRQQVCFEKKCFSSNAIGESILVIAATNDLSVNQSVSKAAHALRIPVNVVDQSDLSTVIFPAIVERDPIVIAISTAGKAPVLARLLRARIESWLPSAYGDLAKLVDQYRERIKALLPDINQRKGFWEKALQGAIGEHWLSHREAQAKKGIESMIDALDQNESIPKVYEGEVYLVGAGPGDADLLSFKALRLLQQADAVLYDRLVSDEIVALARKDAEMIYVGKQSRHHTLAQEGINALLVKLAQEGKRVCRLKGGDPFIFGRGGEEIETLAQSGIAFQVVPGITAASGCASYAGIPLTHRDYSQSVMFVTAHRKQEARFEPNWQAMAAPGQTLVFYMGLSELETITSKLLEAGMSADMPAAVIQQGTTKNQKVVQASLQELAAKVKLAQLRAPTLIIVGQVVRLREKLNWFDS